MQKAKFTLEDMKAGPRPQEIAAAAAAVKVADADRDRALSDYRRANLLMENKQVQSITQGTVRFGEIHVSTLAEARLRDAQKKLELMKDGYRENQIKAAQAAFEQAKWQSTTGQGRSAAAGNRTSQGQSRTGEGRLEIGRNENRLRHVGFSDRRRGAFQEHRGGRIRRARHAGRHHRRYGPRLAAGLRAGIGIDRVKADRKVRVRIDANDKSKAKFYEGRVSFISDQAEFTPKNVQTEKERVKLVFRIKIDITNPNSELKIGMPVDAVIDEGK